MTVNVPDGSVAIHIAVTSQDPEVYAVTLFVPRGDETELQRLAHSVAKKNWSGRACQFFVDDPSGDEKKLGRRLMRHCGEGCENLTEPSVWIGQNKKKPANLEHRAKDVRSLYFVFGSDEMSEYLDNLDDDDESDDSEESEEDEESDDDDDGDKEENDESMEEEDEEDE